MDAVLAKLELPIDGDGMYIGPDDLIHIVHLGKPACGKPGAFTRVEIAKYGLVSVIGQETATFRRKCKECVRRQEAYWAGK